LSRGERASAIAMEPFGPQTPGKREPRPRIDLMARLFAGERGCAALSRLRYALVISYLGLRKDRNMNRRLATWIILVVSMLISSTCWAQGLERGNLIGTHVVTVTLKPGATMDQFVNFYVHEVLPEYEKHWPGLKGYLLRAFFADSKNK